MDQAQQRPPFQYSCYFTRFREGEQFVQEHAFGIIMEGAFSLNDGHTTTTFQKGDIYFCARNHLLKFIKNPADNGEFRSLSIFFDQPVLKAFKLQHPGQAEQPVNASAFTRIPAHTTLTTYMQSLVAYAPLFTQPENGELLKLKQSEALLLLLQAAPQLRSTLFDFSEPGKIDLETFMNQNYHFNVELKRFAYLTGRSLSTFKRDFEKIFHITPSRWLLQRRLQEAHYLIKEKGKAISDIYLDLGFEDLSHFSYAFKKQYGVAPSLM